VRPDLPGSFVAKGDIPVQLVPLKRPEQGQTRKSTEDLLVESLHRAAVYDDDIPRIDCRILHLAAANILQIKGRRLTLATVVPQPAAEGEKADDKAERVLYRERTAARYARTVVLPAEVDSATSQARFDNGVLTLTLAKKVPTGAKKISVE
jgi:hypothetical protein